MTLPSLELLLIAGRGLALITALCTFAWIFHRWRGDAARDAQRVFEQLDLLRAELMATQEQLSRLQLPQAVGVVSRPIPEPQIAKVMNNAAPRGYEVAARLARSGASVDELISNCGLSRHEAALLLRLHGVGSQPTTHPVSATPDATANIAKTNGVVANKPTKSTKSDSNANSAALLVRKSRLSVVG